MLRVEALRVEVLCMVVVCALWRRAITSGRPWDASALASMPHKGVEADGARVMQWQISKILVEQAAALELARNYRLEGEPPTPRRPPPGVFGRSRRP